MKNLKRALTLSLAGVTFLAFTACKEIKSYNVEYQDYRCEGLLKESGIRMYKKDKLAARKTFEDNKPMYEFFDEEGRKFAEAKLNCEIIYIKDRKGDLTNGVYGHLKANHSSGWCSVPLWTEIIQVDPEGDVKENLKPKFRNTYYKSWVDAYDLFIQFLNNERLLEKKYNREF